MARDVLYLQVDARNRADYERAGMGPFKPYPGPQSGTMEYYAVPLDVLESGRDLEEWARKAVEVATASEGRRVTRRTQRPTRRRAD
jgi:DNA transformation protein